MRVELTTFWPPVKRANQAALHPDDAEWFRQHTNIAPFYEKSSRFTCFPSESAVFNDTRPERRCAEKVSGTSNTPPRSLFRTFSDLKASSHRHIFMGSIPSCVSASNIANLNRDYRTNPPSHRKNGRFFTRKCVFFLFSAWLFWKTWYIYWIEHFGA